jgi:hypothetical protein
VVRLRNLCVRVLPNYFCPAKLGPLRPWDQISCSTDPSKANHPLPGLTQEVYKFVATKSVSTGADPSTLPALHYDKRKEERRKKARITPLQAEEPLASSSEGGCSRKQRNREAATAVEDNQELRERLQNRTRDLWI